MNEAVESRPLCRKQKNKGSELSQYRSANFQVRVLEDARLKAGAT
jgi:hypothetical protein